MNEIEEIKSSVKRYIKEVWKREEIKVISPDDENWSLSSYFENDILSLPFILILGAEPDFRSKEKYEDSEDYLKKMTEWKFLYELFPERIGYVSAPFKPELMLLSKSEMNEDKYELDLSKVRKLCGNLCEHLNEKGKEKIRDLKKFVKVAGAYFSAEDLIEKGRIGHETVEEERFLHQIANLIAGCIQCLKEEKKKGGNVLKNVLLIDNYPQRGMNKIDSRFEIILKSEISLKEILELFSEFLNFYYYESDFEDLYLQLTQTTQNSDLALEVQKSNRKEQKERGKIKDFDFILVDMFLGEDVPNGVEFVKLLTSKFPSIPSFALSVSDDFSIIREAIKEGADYYILKNQIFSLPHIYYSYINEIGEILNCFNNDEYRKNLLGNIRYWRFKKNLWFGDKCYHMIDHSFKHTLDDWNFMNEILMPLMREKGKKEKELFGADDKLLYSLCMAVWLHDIGHKGSDLYGEPHLIRDNHAYISGELILKYPKLFRIKDSDEYYKSIDFSQVSALEMIYERKEKKLSVTEMIALFAMYHKSNTPLDCPEYQKLLGKKKNIPLEYYIGKEKTYLNALTLEKILEKREKGIKEKLLQLAALFRFIDSIDIREVRVGDITEKELKETVIKNDKEYQFRKLEKEIKNLSRIHTKTSVQSATFVKSFYQDIKEKIEQGEFTQLNLLKELLEKPEELENYETLVDYAAYIALQTGHFDLHSSVKDLKFEYRGNGRLVIGVITDKPKKWLKEKKVRERGKKEQSVYDRLISDECYIKAELEGAKKHLESFFSKVTIRLEHDSGELYGQRVW